jgi:hypothetical protein
MKQAHDPIHIPESNEFINGLMSNITVDQLQQVAHTELDTAWRSWLNNSSYNTVHALNQFDYSCFSAGTTPAFGEFISRFSTRRVRVSRSDFVLTRILSATYNRSMLYLEDAELDQNDCVIISFPFSGNGSLYPGYNQLLDHADKLQVPVFIDGAYFGISHGIDYPLAHACVTDFSVSLSKHLSGNCLRLGIRFTRNSVDDCISAGLIGNNLFDRLNSYVSIQLLNQFSHDWIIDKYKQSSNLICAQHNLVPTNTITIGLGGQEYITFKRGDYIRVCISEKLSKLS